MRHELFGRPVLKAKETAGARVLSGREPEVLQGSKETNVARKKAASS